MVGVEVEGVEVVPLVLELRTFGDLPPHADEDVGDLLLQERDRMPRTDAGARRERGDVHALGLQSRGGLSFGDLHLTRSERLVHPRARLADELAELRLACRLHIAQPRIELGQRRRFGGVRRAGCLDRGGIGRRGDGVQRCLDGGIHRLGRDLGGRIVAGVRHERRVYRRRMDPPAGATGRRGLVQRGGLPARSALASTSRSAPGAVGSVTFPPRRRAFPPLAVRRESQRANHDSVRLIAR